MTDQQKAEEIADNVIAFDEPITRESIVWAAMQMAKYKDRELLKEYQQKVKSLAYTLLQ